MKSMKFFVLLLLVLPLGHFRYAKGHRPTYSQCGQDTFLYKRFFSQKNDGVFVDIGAHDGMTYSNSYFFEKHLGWKGICVEPMPEIFEKLQACRSCVCVQGCIYDKAETAQFLRVRSPMVNTEMLSGILDQYDPRHRERVNIEVKYYGGSCEEITVQCYKLNALLESNNFWHVDYLSIDTEGGELEILKSIDFERFTIDVIDVENNYRDPEFERFLTSKGYQKLADNPCPFDEMYVRTVWYVNQR